MPGRDLDHNIRQALDRVDAAVDGIDINMRSMLPAFVQLMVLLRARIITRKIKVGEMLPSETELVERYQVSRDTVRRAIQLLRDAGLVETRRGVGHTVVKLPWLRSVTLAPGSHVFIRPAPLDGMDPQSMFAYAVAEPGKPVAMYEAATTLLIVPE